MSGPAMLLQQAARHAHFAAGAGWPEVLTPGELAALQYPHDDTPEGKKRARVQQRDFNNLAASAIKAGELAAESAQLEKSVYQQVQEVRASRDPWLSSLASDEWLARDFGGGRVQTVFKPAKETIEVQALRPASVAAWLALISEQPSRFVFAWLLANGAASEKVGAGGTADCSKEIPGKLPRVAIGKLAIKAAWQIECETKRVATAAAVITKLQDWADAGECADVLSKSDKKAKAVYWTTSKGDSKQYDQEACGKALETWRKSRD